MYELILSGIRNAVQRVETIGLVVAREGGADGVTESLLKEQNELWNAFEMLQGALFHLHLAKETREARDKVVS